MVARIKKIHSLSRAVNYNEKKVGKGVAKCILASGYPKDLERLNFYDKLNRLTKQAELNRNVVANCLHINLNFGPSEKLTVEQLNEIAAMYMDKIGFGNQPYLVYQHHDAGHPHIHIVTTNIQADGSRIDTNNIGRNQSEKARQEIEQAFGLEKATGKSIRAATKINPVNAQKIQYGKSDTKRAITNVLDAVIGSYKYTSLAELNAVLKLYNVVADRGIESSLVYKNEGLNYRVLDSNGNKVGVPVKASSIYSKPTLANLKKKFSENEIRRKPDLKRVKTAIDWVMSKQPQSLQAFMKQLQNEKVSTLLRQNEKGFIYGITFIDHQTKAVFNGSDIGKPYSAKAITEKYPQANSGDDTTKQSVNPAAFSNNNEDNYSPGEQSLLITLLEAEQNYGAIPYALRKKKRKKKRTQKL